MKFYADGSLIGGTAVFSTPYGASGEFSGSMYWESEAFVEAVTDAHRAGWQVGVHAQGDLGIELALDAFTTALADTPVDDPRFRIEHAGFPTSCQLNRMAALGVITINQPSYLVDSGDDFIVRLGGRADGLQPLRSELEAGVGVVLSSDSDVASYRPMDSISAAVRRRTAAGRPIGADQALNLEEALLAHTIEAAFALRMEDRIGSIEPGKLADLTIFDGDVWSAATEDLADMPVWLTVIDGQVAHGPSLDTLTNQ
jgi:predicted amidohydrolase YtcJ